MSKLRILGLLALIGTSLSACGSAGNQSGVLDGIRGTISRVIQGRSNVPQGDLRDQITPEAIAATQTPLLFIELPNRGAQAFLTPIGVNGSIVTWATADGTSISLDRGVATASRGLLADLMSANLAEVSQGVFGGQKQGVRIHRYLNAEDNLEIHSFVCDYARQSGVAINALSGRFVATHVTEDCVDSRQLRFVNNYWIDGRGRIRKSEQWLSPSTGAVTIEVLKE